MQNIILTAYIVLFPLTVLAQFWWIDHRHRHRSVPNHLLVFVSGASLALLSHSLWLVIDQTFSLSQLQLSEEILKSVVFTPLLEECLKAIVLIAIWRRQKVKSITDGLALGLSLGFGFAAAENWIYAFHNGSFASDLVLWYQVWFRTLHTSFLHAATAATFGLCLGLPVENQSLAKRYIWPIGLALAISAHAVWNLLGLLTNTHSLAISVCSVLMNIELFALFFFITLIFLQAIHRKTQTRIALLFCKSLASLILVVGVMMGFYQTVVLQHAKNSTEYKTAERYLVNSPNVINILKIKKTNLLLRDVILTTKNSLHLSVLQFAITDDPEFAFAEITLLQHDAFSLVYEANIVTKSYEKVLLTSTFENLNRYFLSHHVDDIKTCQKTLSLLQEEISDPNLTDYLQAKELLLEQKWSESLTLFDSLLKRLPQNAITLHYDKALLYHNKNEQTLAIEELEKLIKTTALATKTPLPADPWSVNFSPPILIMKSHILLAQIFYDQQNYEQSLFWSKEAATLASSFGASVLNNNALYLKALALQAQGDIKLASLVFDEVISDPENPNLGQKSWAHFFKSETAIRENRHNDALDELELAIQLDPKNPNIRQKAIQYLIERNYPGDLELALAFALRGAQVAHEKENFVHLASQLYHRLEIPDKTLKTE